MQEIVTLICGLCKRKNYSTRKNKKNVVEKLSLKKFCTSCQSHTEHVETK